MLLKRDVQPIKQYNSYEVTHNITSIRNLKAYLNILDRIGA